MPADYKYEHISVGRMKALNMASSRFYGLYAELAKSKIIDPAFMERMRVVNILLGRGVSGVIDTSDRQLLEELLGPDMGEQKQ